MTSLLLFALATANPYRPYLECESYKPRTMVEVLHNVQPDNGLPLYRFSMLKRSRGKSMKVKGLPAERVPSKRKFLLDSIAVANDKGIPDYELFVFYPETDRGFRGLLIERGNEGRNVDCHYLVTGN